MRRGDLPVANIEKAVFSADIRPEHFDSGLCRIGDRQVMDDRSRQMREDLPPFCHPPTAGRRVDPFGPRADEHSQGLDLIAHITAVPEFLEVLLTQRCPDGFMAQVFACPRRNIATAGDALEAAAFTPSDFVLREPEPIQFVGRHTQIHDIKVQQTSCKDNRHRQSVDNFLPELPDGLPTTWREVAGRPSGSNWRVSGRGGGGLQVFRSRPGLRAAASVSRGRGRCGNRRR